PEPVGAQPAGGGGVPTAIAALPVLLSDVAVISAVPFATPVTSPLVLTVAIVALLVDHVTTRPVNTLPLASFVAAVSCVVWQGWTAADVGVTLTVATGTCVTVMLDVPFWPSLVAVIIADPAALALTIPEPLTVASVVLFEAHVTTRPVSGLPFASLGVAVSCVVWPTGRVADAGLTVNEATGTDVTVTVAAPLCPSLVAVTVAEPPARAVTSPLPLTLAIVVSLEDQVTTRPDKGFPFASRGVAVSCPVWPVCRLRDVGLTVTDATGTVETAMLDVPLWPSLVAVIVAEPVPAPVTRPLILTVATEPLFEDHVTVRPVSTLPAESVVVACSCAVAPTTIGAVEGVTLTAATGASVTLTVAVSDTPLGSPVATTLYCPGAVPAALYWP